MTRRCVRVLALSDSAARPSSTRP